MHKDLLKHILVLALCQSAIETKDRIDVLDLDILSMYDQDDLIQSVFAEEEKIVELVFVCHFLHWV